MLKYNFGKRVYDYQVFGVLLQGYALALEKTNQLTEAKQMCQQALKSYDQAKDWEDDDSKTESVLFTTMCLDDIEKKLLDQK